MNIWPIFSLGVAIANNYNIARQFWVVCVNSPGQMTKCKYIVLEGPIGGGNTSLAKLLARPEVLYKRVKKRDKKYERSVTFEYLSGVAQAYNQFFFHYDDTPLLVVNTSEIDFVASSKQLADLIKEINNMGSGTQHYIPLGSRSFGLRRMPNEADGSWRQAGIHCSLGRGLRPF